MIKFTATDVIREILCQRLSLVEYLWAKNNWQPEWRFPKNAFEKWLIFLIWGSGISLTYSSKTYEYLMTNLEKSYKVLKIGPQERCVVWGYLLQSMGPICWSQSHYSFDQKTLYCIYYNENTQLALISSSSETPEQHSGKNQLLWGPWNHLRQLLGPRNSILNRLVVTDRALLNQFVNMSVLTTRQFWFSNVTV